MKNMNELVSEYLRTGEGKGKLVARILEDLFVNWRRYGLGRNEDQALDSITLLHPKIFGMLDRYVDTGRGFQTYLSKSVKMYMRTVAEKRKAECLREKISYVLPDIWMGRQGGRCALESPSLRIDAGIEKRARETGPFREAAFRRRVFFLLLKCAPLADGATVKAVSRYSGIDELFILDCIRMLRERMEDRAARLSKRIERRDGLFFSILCNEERLKEETDSEKRATLARRIQGERKKLRQARWLIRRNPAAPTNQEISEVIGVPKGTIDSGLHYLKALYPGLTSRSEMRYDGEHGDLVRDDELA